MEENKNQKKKKSIIDSSVVLSFVVSIVAIFSLAMFGIVSNQDTDISYAEPTEGGSGTTTVIVDVEKQGTEKISINAEGVATVGDSGATYVTNFPLYRYLTRDGRQIYCIEYKNGVVDGDEYNYVDSSAEGAFELDSKIERGIIYIINSKLDITMPSGGEANKKYVETWVKQAAIWLYIDNNTVHPAVIPSDVTKIEDNEGNSKIPAIRGANKIQLIVGSDVQEIYRDSHLGETVFELALAAKAAGESEAAASSLTLNKAEKGDKAVKDDNGNILYYQSSLITVTSTSNLVSYEVSFNEEGVEAYDEDGNKLTNPITSTNKFYVRIPADKVKYPDSKKVDVTVNAKFDEPKAVVMEALEGTNRQRLIDIGTKEHIVSKGVEIVVTPDTGVNATQAIYFIGLIVLLCGVGIVYANAKPVQSKQ